MLQLWSTKVRIIFGVASSDNNSSSSYNIIIISNNNTSKNDIIEFVMINYHTTTNYCFCYY